MVTRRKVLAGVATSGVIALAGCGRCDGTIPTRFSLTVDGIRRTDGGWSLDVTAETYFSADVKADVTGVTLGGYDADGSLVGTAPLRDFLWEDVPEEEVDDGECGESGSLSQSVTLSTDGFPHYVGPRFQSYPDLDYSVDVEALIYDPGRETPTTDGRDTPENASVGRSGPDDVTPDDYRRVRVDAFPWPRTVGQAVERTDQLSEVTFEHGADCVGSWEEPTLDDDYVGDRDAEFTAVRSTPDRECTLPYLESIEYLGSGEFEARIGIREVDRTLCRDCSYRRYTLGLTLRDGGTARSVERVTAVHLSPDGEVVERVRAPSDSGTDTDTPEGGDPAPNGTDTDGSTPGANETAGSGVNGTDGSTTGTNETDGSTVSGNETDGTTGTNGTDGSTTGSK